MRPEKHRVRRPFPWARATSFALAFVALLVLLVYVSPIAWMTLTSFKPDSEVLSNHLSITPRTWDFGAYSEIVTRGFLTYIGNSAIVALGSTLASTTLALLAAYGFSRFRFRASRSLLLVMVLSQLVPFVVLVTPVYVLYSRVGLTNSRLGLTIAYTAMSVPFSAFMLLGYMNTIPGSLDEAARIDGAATLSILWRVVTPLMWPGLVTVAIYAFARGWEEFLLATALISSEANKTLPVGLAGLFGQFTTQWNVVMAAAVVSTVPVMIVFLALQGRLVGDFTGGGVK
jgi:multiple sugar transport system permease protein